jgi:hypothetical protein
MARAATTEEKALFRTPGSWSRLWLAVYKPNTVYTARLAAVPSSTDRVASITYNTGSGTLADVKAEMTLWVGSTAGARDLGVCRIRKAPISGTLYIGMTSEIDWQSNCYLTVVDLFPISARVPFMDNGALKMDYDLAYSNQHATFDPVPVLGPHAVAWLTGATVDVTFDSSNSWVFGSSISSRSWSAPGASATSGMTTNTPTITYNAAGYYRVYCTVTAANGKSYTGIRHVFIFDADNLPHRVEITDSPTVDESTGGWSYGVKFHASTADEIVEGALAILFAENWHGSTKQSIGPVTSRENILCVGYIAGESIEWDSEASTVEFTVHGAHEALSQIEINPVALKCATDTPAEWGVVSALTADRAAFHLLHWRTNVTALMDFYPSNDARYSPVFEASQGDVWNQLEQIGAKIYARGGVDRFGRLFFEVHPNLVPEADRAWAIVMTITEKDYSERVSVTRSTRRKMSMLASSGWVSDAYGNTNIVYSLAMGHVHARHGRGEVKDQLLAEDQTQFNELTGLAMGKENAEFEFALAFPYLNGLVDVFPRQFLDITLAAGDTPRGVGYAGNLVPRSVTLQYDPESLSITTEVECDPETFPELAVNGDVPADTGVTDWDDSTIPDFDMPDFGDIGDFGLLPPSVENPNHPKVVVIASTQGVFYTQDFDADNPTWKAMNNGFAEDDAIEIANLVVCPNGALYCLTRSSTGWEKVYRASALGGTWVDVFDAAVYGGTNPRVTGLGVSDEHDELVAICVGNAFVNFGSLDTHKIYVSDGGGFAPGDYVRTKYRDRYTAIVYSKGSWYVFGSRPIGIGGSLSDSRFWVYNAGGGLVSDQNGVNWGSGAGAGASSTYAVGGALVICWGNGVAGYNIINDLLGTSQTHVTTEISPSGLQAIAMAPPFVYGMGASGGSSPYKTTDSGASWQSVGGVIPIGSDVWAHCGDNNRFIFGGGTTLRLTVDQGATYVDKAGNLAYIAASQDIFAIRFIA